MCSRARPVRRARAAASADQARQEAGQRLAGAGRRDQQGRAPLLALLRAAPADAAAAASRARRTSRRTAPAARRCRRRRPARAHAARPGGLVFAQFRTLPRLRTRTALYGSIAAQRLCYGRRRCASSRPVRQKERGRHGPQAHSWAAAPWACSSGSLVLSLVVGIILSALGITPGNIFSRSTMLLQRIYDLGFGAFQSVLGYLLLGAMVVVPIWFISRLIKSRAPRRSPDSRRERWPCSGALVSAVERLCRPCRRHRDRRDRR